MALGTRTKFQLQILKRSMISVIHKFRDNAIQVDTIEALSNWANAQNYLYFNKTTSYFFICISDTISISHDGTKQRPEPVLTYDKWDSVSLT